MKEGCLLLVILSFALLGQDRSWVQEREAEHHLVPYDSIRAKVGCGGQLRIVGGKAIETIGNIERRPKPLIQTPSLTIAADEMEWNHVTGEIKLSGNVLVKLSTAR